MNQRNVKLAKLKKLLMTLPLDVRRRLVSAHVARSKFKLIRGVLYDAPTSKNPAVIRDKTFGKFTEGLIVTIDQAAKKTMVEG